MDKPTVEQRWQLARKCADVLYDKGCSRVWLFGALAMGCKPDQASDLDFVVEGLKASQLQRIAGELTTMCQCEVDLLDMRTVHFGFRPHLLRTRVLLTRGD